MSVGEYEVPVAWLTSFGQALGALVLLEAEDGGPRHHRPRLLVVCWVRTNGSEFSLDDPLMCAWVNYGYSQWTYAMQG